MTDCPQSWQTPRIVTNDLRRIFSAVSVSSVRMAGAYVRHSHMGEVEKTSGRFRDKGQRLLFFKDVASHIAQGRPPVLRIEETKASHAISLCNAR
jgi:hypothetical protein